MTEVVKFRNFERYQHYRDRHPPWIKLYARLWRDREFAALPDRAKAHLIGLLSIASQCDNRIPWDRAWLERELAATDSIDLNCLMSSGMLERCEQLASKVLCQVEKSREEKNTEPPCNPPAGDDPPGSASAQPPTGPQNPTDISTPTGLFARLWFSYPRHESRQKAWTAFRRLKPTPSSLTLDFMLAWLERAKRSHQWQNPNLIPHLATWLNQRRWENDPPPRMNGRPPDPGATPPNTPRIPDSERPLIRAKLEEQKRKADAERAAHIRSLVPRLRNRQDRAWLRAYEATEREEPP